MYTKGDFHMHSTFSDGVYTPTELVLLAKESNLDIISITDHNRISGVKQGVLSGDTFGIKVVPGVEISCRHRGVKTHVLGYFSNNILDNELFESALSLIRKGDLSACNLLLLNHINLEKDETNKKISVKSAIDFIHFFNGVAILAHPIKLPFEIFSELISLNLDGLEGRYFKNSQADTNFFLKICKEKQWIYTAGSDFHTDKRYDKRHGILGDATLNSSEISIFLKLVNEKSERN
ncbi:MAG: PHP domain-containing protein [Clostridium sp.]